MEETNESVISQEHIESTSEKNNWTYDDLFPALPQNQGTTSDSFLQKHMRVGSSFVTQVIHVPCEERKSSDSEKFGEGESLRTCQQIMKETGAHIEISSGKDNSLTFLVKGKSNEVLDARRKILIHFQTQASKQISIPKEHRRIILGKKGERLKELEKQTATKINVPNANDDSDTITISGIKENIEKAESEIRIMIDEQSKKTFERLSIPRIYHPFILGAFGETLGKIFKETGAKINIPPQSVMKDEISITGEKESVLAAKEKVEKIYKDMEKKCSIVSVEVSKSQHRHIIGPRGQTLQEILEETGVWVEMPPSDSNTDTITLRGPQTCLGNALTIVYEKANSVKTVFLDAPSWIHKYIIGRKGSNIEKFEQEFPHVNIFCLENTVKLEGPPPIVDKAQSHLENLITELLRENTIEVMKVNPMCIKHIIGKGGVNIKRLKEEYQININIDEPNSDKIRFVGNKEGVANAMRELQEQINKLENEKIKDVIIEHRLHRSVIGTKGENIREIKDRYKNVQIFFPSFNENSDIVKLKGPKEEVDKCGKDLLKLVKQIQESSFVIEVPIFKQFHKFIIGKGGANIKKIRDETQTKIDLPSEGDTNDVIKITGRKENVLDAKERILKIQGELSEIVTDEVKVTSNLFNSLLGNSKKLISSIADECGVNIKLPSNDMKNENIIIRGSADDVAKGKNQLIQLLNELEANSFTAEIRTKQQHHKFLIGKSGASIRRIRESTGARIVFPTIDCEDKELIVIIGKEENVKAAKEQLEKMIEEIEKETEDEIMVKQKYHKYFTKRYVLRQIYDECGVVQIFFPKQGQESDRVILKGAKDCIETAKQRIQEIVENLDSQVTIEVNIPQKHHRNIKGLRGTKVQNIAKECDVQIKFPDRELVAENIEGEESNDQSNQTIRQCDIVRITGRKEKCDAAKQALLNLVPITEEVNVPFDFHGSIIGQKGKDVKELMSTYDVYIELSPQELKQDIIKITGTPSNICATKEALAKRVEELEIERRNRELRSFELKIEVDSEYHPKIIGRRGTNVTRLRSEYNVNISFPNKDNEISNFITITGYEINAKACRDEILKMVSELDDLYKKTIEVDSSVHNRLIGQRGRNIRRIMDDYKVDIRLPKENDSNPNIITISGQEEDVENACDHILCLTEEYLQDVNYTIQQVFKTSNTNSNGFVVHGAPWEKEFSEKEPNDIIAPNTQSEVDFPNFGSPATNNETPAITKVWGPKR